MLTDDDFVHVVDWLDNYNNFALLHGTSYEEGQLKCSNEGLIALAKFLHSIGVLNEVQTILKMKKRFFHLFNRYTWL